LFLLSCRFFSISLKAEVLQLTRERFGGLFTESSGPLKAAALSFLFSDLSGCFGVETKVVDEVWDAILVDGVELLTGGAAKSTSPVKLSEEEEEKKISPLDFNAIIAGIETVTSVLKNHLQIARDVLVQQSKAFQKVSFNQQVLASKSAEWNILNLWKKATTSSAGLGDAFRAVAPLAKMLLSSYGSSARSEAGAGLVKRHFTESRNSMDPATIEDELICAFFLIHLVQKRAFQDLLAVLDERILQDIEEKKRKYESQTTI